MPILEVEFYPTLTPDELLDAEDILKLNAKNHAKPFFFEPRKHFDMDTIKHTMWYYVGLVRTRRLLNRALNDLGSLRHDIESFYRTAQLDLKIIQLRSAALASIVIARAAWENRESHGCHYRKD